MTDDQFNVISVVLGVVVVVIGVVTCLVRIHYNFKKRTVSFSSI